MGERQHYLLAALQHKKYLKDLKLLSIPFNPNEVFIGSTDVNRTIMSVYAELQGYFDPMPPFKSEPQQEAAVPPFGFKPDPSLKDSITKSGMP